MAVATLCLHASSVRVLKSNGQASSIPRPVKLADGGRAGRETMSHVDRLRGPPVGWPTSIKRRGSAPILASGPLPEGLSVMARVRRRCVPIRLVNILPAPRETRPTSTCCSSAAGAPTKAAAVGVSGSLAVGLPLNLTASSHAPSLTRIDGAGIDSRERRARAWCRLCAA